MANFDRDFGYLMPFLDKIEAAASSAPAGAREELSTLVRGEKERWRRIQALLAGAPPSPAKRAPAPTPPPAAEARPAPKPSSGFTVGSLRRG